MHIRLLSQSLVSLFFTCLPICAFAQSTADSIFHSIKPYLFAVETAVGQHSSKSSYGTGFAIDTNGLVATNYHVVAEHLQYPDRYSIFIQQNGTRQAAKVINFDVLNDLAILKVETSFKGFLPISQILPNQGATIFSAGLPKDLGQSIIQGTYNGILSDGPFSSILMDASLNAGMSGGPILNGKGQVIGVNVAILRQAQNISFGVLGNRLVRLLKTNNDVPPSPEETQEQLLLAEKNLLQQFEEESPPAESLGEWEAWRPQKALKCWADKKKEKKEKRRRVQHDVENCHLQKSVSLSRETRALNYESVIRVIKRRGQNAWSFYRHVGQLHKFHLETGPSGSNSLEYFSKFSCREKMIKNSHQTQLLVNSCIRGYDKYRKLFDFQYKIFTLNSKNTILSIQGRLGGFSLDGIKQVFARQIESIKMKGRPN